MQRITKLEDQMPIALGGVSNFRLFQLDMKEKVGFVYGAIKTAAWLTAIVGPILLGIAAWFFTQMAYPAIKLILEDYYKRHPAASIHYTDPQDTKPELEQAVEPLQNTHIGPMNP